VPCVRAPKGASARVRSFRPLAGVRWASLVRRSFYWGRPVANPPRTPANPRTVQITPRILDGKKDKQIAGALKISFWTVRTHLTRTFARVGVADRLELALRVPFVRSRLSAAAHGSRARRWALVGKAALPIDCLSEARGSPHPAPSQPAWKTNELFAGRESEISPASPSRSLAEQSHAVNRGGSL
jgi:DNA-binding CsgD family transcriptional regulator